ncbi:MAG: hypothetical protein HAW67_02765 [Endozoicomonadaceae bacterium]|nr:hypothetical protein [Endozoicomonadaceae bacterium]
MMAKTRHIQQRMSQRCIKDEMLELIGQFGSWNGDRCILNEKACSKVLQALEAMRKQLVHAKEKGGFVLVNENGADITAYRLDSYTRH